MAWVLRAILHQRAGELQRAAVDLAVARDALGEDPCVLFHDAVQAAAEGAPPARVRDLLERAQRADYELWGEEGWSAELYPSLVPYVGQPGFEMLTHR